MITLPDSGGNVGVEVRILLAECVNPSRQIYNFADAKESMQLMDAVLWNRLEAPRAFGARGASSLREIVSARGQFAGFGSYPRLASHITINLHEMLHIANTASDRRSNAYAEFISLAIDIASSNDYSDPSPGKLLAWRTAGSGSPGAGFFRYKTLMGNDFYYQ